MSYQLIIKFEGDSLSDYDMMVNVEDDLIEALAGVAEVDGHDVGTGETNIFIIGADPMHAFECAKSVLQLAGLLGVVSAAYRPIFGNTFSVLWPPGRQEFSVA